METQTTPTASPSVAQLQAILERTREQYPAAGEERVNKATSLVLWKRAERGMTPGVWWVESETDPTQHYIVVRPARARPSCNCKDWMKRGAETGACKHILASALADALERLEADLSAPEPLPTTRQPCVSLNDLLYLPDEVA